MQPNSGFNWTNIIATAAGTVQVTDHDTRLRAVYIPASATGTVTIYDTTSTLGTASAGTARALTFVNDTVDFPTYIPLDLQMKTGIVAVTGGTTNLTVIWG